MKVLGVDPGLRATGYGLIQYNGPKIKLIEAGTIKPSTKDLIQIRIKKIYKNLDDIIKQYKPNVMVLEKLYAHYRHPTTSILLGHVRGVICLLCAQHNIKLEEHSVKRIRKSITGSGRASQKQNQKMVAHVLGINEKNLTADASDALALALGYINFIVNR